MDTRQDDLTEIRDLIKKNQINEAIQKTATLLDVAEKGGQEITWLVDLTAPKEDKDSKNDQALTNLHAIFSKLLDANRLSKQASSKQNLVLGKQAFQDSIDLSKQAATELTNIKVNNSNIEDIKLLIIILKGRAEFLKTQDQALGAINTLVTDDSPCKTRQDIFKPIDKSLNQLVNQTKGLRDNIPTSIVPLGKEQALIDAMPNLITLYVTGNEKNVPLEQVHYFVTKHLTEENDKIDENFKSYTQSNDSVKKYADLLKLEKDFDKLSLVSQKIAKTVTQEIEDEEFKADKERFNGLEDELSSAESCATTLEQITSYQSYLSAYLEKNKHLETLPYDPKLLSGLEPLYQNAWEIYDKQQNTSNPLHRLASIKSWGYTAQTPWVNWAIRLGTRGNEAEDKRKIATNFMNLPTPKNKSIEESVKEIRSLLEKQLENLSQEQSLAEEMLNISQINEMSNKIINQNFPQPITTKAAIREAIYKARIEKAFDKTFYVYHGAYADNDGELKPMDRSRKRNYFWGQPIFEDAEPKGNKAQQEWIPKALYYLEWAGYCAGGFIGSPIKNTLKFIFEYGFKYLDAQVENLMDKVKKGDGYLNRGWQYNLLIMPKLLFNGAWLLSRAIFSPITSTKAGAKFGWQVGITAGEWVGALGGKIAQLMGASPKTQHQIAKSLATGVKWLVGIPAAILLTGAGIGIGLAVMFLIASVTLPALFVLIPGGFIGGLAALSTLPLISALVPGNLALASAIAPAIASVGSAVFASIMLLRNLAKVAIKAPLNIYRKLILPVCTALKKYFSPPPTAENASLTKDATMPQNNSPISGGSTLTMLTGDLKLVGGTGSPTPGPPLKRGAGTGSPTPRLSVTTISHLNLDDNLVEEKTYNRRLPDADPSPGYRRS